MSENTEAITHLTSGATYKSSKIPALHLIPTEVWLRLATRFELDVERKGEGAWNALSNNQEILLNREALLERLGHLMKHTLALRDNILAGKPLDGDDHAAAILWCGAFFCCATKAMATETLDTTTPARRPRGKDRKPRKRWHADAAPVNSDPPKSLGEFLENWETAEPPEPMQHLAK